MINHVWMTRLDDELYSGLDDGIGAAPAAGLVGGDAVEQEAAQLFGATEQEMKEAILMGGMTVMFSNNITGAYTDLERFQKEVDRAVTHMSKQSGGAKKSAPQPRV